MPTRPRSADTPGQKSTGATTTTPGPPTASTTTVAPSTSTTVPPGLPPEKCPDAKTCRRYAFTQAGPVRYRAGADGRVPVEWWLNPTGLDTDSLSIEQAEAAIAAAFDTWQRAAPSLRFVYRGRTDRLAKIDDHVNVVAFHGPGSTTYPSAKDGNPEFDITLASGAWTWAPCEQRDGACTPLKTGSDLQSIVTHEAGHALWLGHVIDQDLDREMTMYDKHSLADRSFSTLALGDVLGIRAIYPCSCPLPPIYSP